MAQTDLRLHLDTESFTEALRSLAQAGVTAAEAAQGFQEAMNLARVPMNESRTSEQHLMRWLEGRHLMVIQRNDFQAGFEIMCRICGHRVLFIPQDAVRLRAMRVTMDQIDVMAGEHYCLMDETKIDKAVEADPVRMIRFRRET